LSASAELLVMFVAASDDFTGLSVILKLFQQLLSRVSFNQIHFNQNTVLLLNGMITDISDV